VKKQKRPTSRKRWIAAALKALDTPVRPDEGFETNIKPPKRPATVSEGRKQLEQAAGVSFHDDAEAELLVDLVKDWDEARAARKSNRLRTLLKLRKQARALGAEVTAFELRLHDASPTSEVTDRQWQQYTLRVLVAMIAEIWREHGGKGSPSYYSDYLSKHDGPLLCLLLELFAQADIPEDRRPGSHTLHNAIRSAAVQPKFP
jgi:hypothetical protein